MAPFTIPFVADDAAVAPGSTGPADATAAPRLASPAADAIVTAAAASLRIFGFSILFSRWLSSVSRLPASPRVPSFPACAHLFPSRRAAPSSGHLPVAVRRGRGRALRCTTDLGKTCNKPWSQEPPATAVTPGIRSAKDIWATAAAGRRELSLRARRSPVSRQHWRTTYQAQANPRQPQA